MKIADIVIFFISLLCLSLELFLVRILNLKTWNHCVYVIIPFAILGYGIGANLYLVLKSTFDKFGKDKLMGYILLLLSLSL